MELPEDSTSGLKFVIDWTQLHRDAKALAWKLREIAEFDSIIAVTRGGLIPAAIVAQELNIRVIDTIGIQSYNDENEQAVLFAMKWISEGMLRSNKTLVIDDLADTGDTLRFIQGFLPDCHYASIYAKPLGKNAVDTYVTEVSQNTWIYFPWE